MYYNFRELPLIGYV